MKRQAQNTLTSQNSADSDSKRKHNLTTYQDILSAITEVDLSTDQLATLANTIETLYAIRVNRVIQNFPFDLLAKIINSPKFTVTNLLPLRLVCQSWNKVISSFSKVNTKGRVNDLSRMLAIFPLRSLAIYPESISPDFSFFTGLSELKVIDPNPPSPAKYSRNLTELAVLTNLSKLILGSAMVTSLGPLTGLTYLSLKRPQGIQRPEIDRLKHLTQLIAEDPAIFTKGRGIWKHTFNKGSSYEGEFKDGLPNGQGIRYQTNGSRSEGHFVNGLLEGQGQVFDSNGTLCYEGNFKTGKMNGEGTQYWKGHKYEGEFHEGRREGLGVLYQADGRKYTGPFKNGSPEGEGVLITPGGTRYTGQFKGGRPNGHGDLWRADGMCYSGNFKNTVPDGQGTMSFPDGTRYAGHFKWNSTAKQLEVTTHDGEKHHIEKSVLEQILFDVPPSHHPTTLSQSTTIIPMVVPLVPLLITPASKSQPPATRSPTPTPTPTPAPVVVVNLVNSAESIPPPTITPRTTAPVPAWGLDPPHSTLSTGIQPPPPTTVVTPSTLVPPTILPIPTNKSRQAKKKDDP